MSRSFNVLLVVWDDDSCKVEVEVQIEAVDECEAQYLAAEGYVAMHPGYACKALRAVEVY